MIFFKKGKKGEFIQRVKNIVNKHNLPIWILKIQNLEIILGSMNLFFSACDQKKDA